MKVFPNLWHTFRNSHEFLAISYNVLEIIWTHTECQARLFYTNIKIDFFWQTFHVQQTIQQKTDAPTIQNITIEKNEHITKNTIQSLNKNKKYIIKIKDK